MLLEHQEKASVSYNRIKAIIINSTVIRIMIYWNIIVDLLTLYDFLEDVSHSSTIFMLLKFIIYYVKWCSIPSLTNFFM